LTEVKLHSSPQRDDEALEAVIGAIELLRAADEGHEVVKSILDHVHAWTDCEAVGLRLIEGDDYPYFETRGFPPEFVQLENQLCARDAEGSILLDSTGSPVLDCMCGNVLSGRVDPERPFFTSGGSFWTNSTTALLASTTEEDRLARTRNRCNSEGYESVALVPLRWSGRTIGLLQLNDHRPSRFSLERIGMVERVATAIAMVLSERRMSDALRASEERYRALFERNMDAVLMTVPEGVIVDANPAACALLGMSKEEICAAGRAGILEATAELDRLIAGRAEAGAASGTLVFKRGNGTVFPADASSVILDGPGGEKRAFVIFRDITERQRAEASLRASEEMMRYIIKHDPNAIAVYDRDLRYIAVSDRYLGDYGIKDSDITGRHHYEVLPEIREDWRQVHQRVLAGAIERADDDLFIRLDGTVTYNRWECRPWYRPDGEIGGMITYTEVTTERKLAEQALRESEERHRVLFESMLEGCAYCQMVYDDAGRPVDWIYLAANETLRRVPGFEAAVGRKATELIPDLAQIHPELLQVYGRVASTGVPERFQVNFKPIGRTLDIGVSSPSSGYFVALFEDVTDALLAEEKLLQSQKMEAIGRLAGGIAHDFNNILTAIIGYCDLLTADPIVAGSSLESDIAEIREAGQKAAGLTRQILAFSRRQTLRPEILSVNDLLGETEPLLRRTLGEDIELTVLLDAGVREIEVDPTQMMQVVMNLAVNARDAMPLGGNLVLRTYMDRLAADPGGSPDQEPSDIFVVLSVSDTGLGMTDEVRSRIFEPFFTTKSDAEGTGLGLSTVYGIVAQSGGQIRVVSKSGEGTSFHLYFPPATSEKDTNHVPAALPQRIPRLETVLVVEDEPSLQELVSRMLTSRGYRAIVADDAAAAMVLLSEEETRIDVLLADVILAGAIQGPDVARYGRSVRPGLSILYVSGYTMDRLPVAELDERTGFLPKPFSADQLMTAIGEVLGPQRWQADQAPPEA
jgi:two-component system, cell cycle sensor histidine kinase and response regulator CckA